MTDLAPDLGQVSKFTPKPDLPPPPNTTGVSGWLRYNLFNGVFNSVLTILSIIAILFLVKAFYEWAFVNAIWEASSRDECRISSTEIGTCWAGVNVWFTRFIYGRYADAEIWRINLAFIIFIIWMAPLWLPKITSKIFIGLSAVLIYPFLAGYMFLGGERGWFMEVMVAFSLTCFLFVLIHSLLCLMTGLGLYRWVVKVSGFSEKNEHQHKYPVIGFTLLTVAIVAYLINDITFKYMSNNLWGGLFLTLVISGIAIASALPAGIILALGRRSKMAVIRVLCVAFIELFRSVPLITILFMATTMFPLFLPGGMVINKLASAIVAVCLFAAAYMAEVVRGGLQAIPKGQYEAAEAVGLTYWQATVLIVMPQALKFMIPNIVGNFMGLLKDTTLVSIIGLYDLLGMINAVSHDPKWIGLHHEPLFTAAVLFFIGCFAMSKYSQHLERSLGAGNNR